MAEKPHYNCMHKLSISSDIKKTKKQNMGGHVKIAIVRAFTIKCIVTKYFWNPLKGTDNYKNETAHLQDTQQTLDTPGAGYVFKLNHGNAPQYSSRHSFQKTHMNVQELNQVKWLKRVTTSTGYLAAWQYPVNGTLYNVKSVGNVSNIVSKCQVNSEIPTAKSPEPKYT